MGRFIFGVIVGICLVAGGAYYYLTSGRAPVAATAQPMPFETTLAKQALHATLQREAPKQVPLEPVAENLAAGARVYAQNCAFCHGFPHQPDSVEGKGMFPHAPQLFTPDGMVTDDPPGVTYWKVKNGIRLSGMPSFQSALSDQQMWQVSLLLSKADKLPPEAAGALQPAPAPTPALAPAPPPARRPRRHR
ncbi:MAG TPA: cytochrome c [Candidatus Acidoferrales bacterium]|nr:cytochrome c [Candidatus Acidoferrales bacterium]